MALKRDDAGESPLTARIRGMLDAVEVPLKAANRLVAGIPLVGAPVSEAARILWEQVNAAAGRR